MNTDYYDKLNELAKIKNTPAHFGKGSGDGIIYVGGGKYWEMIVVGIKMLRESGCKLPIEVWYRGKCERVIPEEVYRLDVELINLDCMGNRLGDNRVPTGNVGQGGWEAKLYALYHTDFDRVLFLDADAYVVNDPTDGFHLLDTDTGFVYWEDLDNQLNTINWEELYPEGRKLNLLPIQGGQFYIDRNKCRKLITLANYMCQNSDHYFKYLFGDQDTWRVAIATLFFAKEPVTLLKIGKAEWVASAFVCSLNSTPLVVHRCQGKIFLTEHIPVGSDRCSNPQYSLPKEALVFDKFAELVNGRGRTADMVFRETYARRLWGINPSGAGSTLVEGQLYIDTVTRLARLCKWNTCVDVGCGDGLLGSMLNFKSYIGYDCVKEMVTQCQHRYEKAVPNGHRTYNLLDFYSNSDKIDSADVLLCKDVLHHWPNEWVRNFLTYLISTKKWKAIVICQDDNQMHDNQDCHLGGYRALSVKLKPLSEFPITYTVPIHHKTMCVISTDG